MDVYSYDLFFQTSEFGMRSSSEIVLTFCGAVMPEDMAFSQYEGNTSYRLVEARLLFNVNNA